MKRCDLLSIYLHPHLLLILFSMETVILMALPGVPLQPASASSLSGHVAISPVQHRRSVERNGCAQQQPESPASYSGSMEVSIIFFGSLIGGFLQLKEYYFL